MRSAAAAAAAVALLAVSAPPASAGTFTLPSADVHVVVQPNGLLLVEEHISFSFSGTFTGAYREIPLRRGELIAGPFVAENGRRYQPGASAELGSEGPPDTFGVKRSSDGVRIVWHYRAADETRTFTVGYQLAGVAVAYDDVVDVNIKVWGDEWRTGLGRLTATMKLPGRAAGRDFRVWGHPVWVRGDVRRLGDEASLRAVDVPAHQWVEMRVVFPRRLLTSTEGAIVRPGRGLPRILAEERAGAASYDRDRRRIDSWVHHPARSALVLLGLAFVPALLLLGGVFSVFGRERRLAYDREYEQEPPSDLQPALVPSLLRQQVTCGSLEFTATLFDLIQRGRYVASPTTTETSLWGGLRHEDVADLRLVAGEQQPLAPWEYDVAAVVDSALPDADNLLSKLRHGITEHRTANAKRFKDFKSHVEKGVHERGWYLDAALKVVVPVVGVLAGIGVLLFWYAQHRWRGVAPRWSDVVLIALGACLVANAIVIGAAALVRPALWRRLKPEAELEAKRWEAFRRYLTDFPRLDVAPPASLELWERYLVYGIAFGIADRVLQAAHLKMPQQLHDQSSLYWISLSNDIGSGPTALGISDLSSGFGSALAPPNSGGGGFGGGFSGGGGGGAGGGGGGAW